MVNVPRVVIAAPSSGRARRRSPPGCSPRSGRADGPSRRTRSDPDYIDPGYHALAAGRPGRNLDPWLVGEERIAPLFLHGATTPTTADIAIIEGVMGLFDGASGAGRLRLDGARRPAARRAGRPGRRRVRAPRGRSRRWCTASRRFDPTIRIGGVIFNRVGSPGHAAILREAVEPMGVPVLGAVMRQDALAVPSRHLGLIPAAERTTEARDVVERLAVAVAEQVDLDGVERLARSAPPLQRGRPDGRARRVADVAGPDRHRGRAGVHLRLRRTRRAAARRRCRAWCASIPPRRDAADRTSPRWSSAAVFPRCTRSICRPTNGCGPASPRWPRSGAPIVAECAGLLYLARTLDGRPMCGVLDIEAEMGPRLTLGYRDAVAVADSPLVACRNAGARPRVPPHADHARPRRAGGLAVAAQRRRRPKASSTVASTPRTCTCTGSGVPGAAQRFVDAARAHRRVAA